MAGRLPFSGTRGMGRPKENMKAFALPWILVCAKIQVKTDNPFR